ncbi:MAG: NAD-dependent epimerase/dehydratase family protein [Candidatus Melainabacteria bacterium]|nr:MAG: NAD-dependent epimerase/dehydratase family protein [Candidatus Melainabacteria bacterium]
MHLLVIGGTVFLGRHIVLEALASGHKVTTLNRGTHVLPEQENVEKLIDDREKDLDILAGRKFDAVIDVCGYKPEVVAQSAEILKNAVETYLFVSTISVYGSFEKIGLNESDPIKHTTLKKPGDYGTFKADCEKVLQEIVPEKALIVRPGLIVGPFDPTDRFTYWPARIARGGKVVAPGKPDAAMQFIDVRDLARWLIELTENGERGIYNATGPRQRLTLGEFLESSNRALNGNCEFIWLDDEILENEKVQSFADLPFWIPASSAEYAGFQQIDCSKAFNAGLKFRPLEQTVRDTLAWHHEHRSDRSDRSKTKPLAVGISPERERELIEKYH